MYGRFFNKEGQIMNKYAIYLPFAVLATTLTACTPPEKDIPGLKTKIDASVKGHYGTAMEQEELAEHRRNVANKVLEHWENDHYWNISEKEKAMKAAQDSAIHRMESEKALCKWLTAVHGNDHHPAGTAQYAAAYFETGSAIPYKTNDREVAELGKFLASHPTATADLLAYTDTVGKTKANQKLAEQRATSISRMLINYGARMEQLHITPVGEADGPDNRPNQQHRIVKMSTIHPTYNECPEAQQ
jgi:outer membrane protein OmpA-like peptidoglycan-associated protein